MPRPTFSLKMMLAAVTAVALPFAALTAKPSYLSGLAMMLLATAFPPIFWIGYGLGGRYTRAFCIGAFAPAMVAALFLAFSLITVTGPQTVAFDECLAVVAKLAEFYRFLLAFFWTAMPVVGMFCVVAAWTLEGHESPDEK
ncbi:MAG TPA: hypothetical protein VG125_20185 [Pirellulales bacterium]|jgi:hypothetical protein|nr:hypothetical protein [Pirellulales bacterium]